MDKRTDGRYMVWFVCCVPLSPKSTAMVKAGRSVYLTILFPGQAWTTSSTYFRLLLTTTLLEWFSAREENDHRNNFMINLHQSMRQGQDQTRDPCVMYPMSYKLVHAVVWSVVRLAYVARHVTDCASWPGDLRWRISLLLKTEISNISFCLAPIIKMHANCYYQIKGHLD